MKSWLIEVKYIFPKQGNLEGKIWSLSDNPISIEVKLGVKMVNIGKFYFRINGKCDYEWVPEKSIASKLPALKMQLLIE
jgi:hypothetical protein